MKNLAICLILVAATALLTIGCKDTSSEEACLHQAGMDLDAGQYDAVIASPCADSLQKGAAYFGRAGFDTNHVMNTFIQTGVATGTTTTQNNITLYMTSLVGAVTGSTLSDLDSSTTEYSSVPTTAYDYRDAQFYLSLVDTVKGLSLMKLIISDAAGSLDTSCDINANSTADGADAGACALIAASNISAGTTETCSNASYSPATPVDITFTDKSGTYSGLTITLGGTETAACPAVHKRLLYRDGSGHYWVAATSPDLECDGSDGNTWPCPIEQNGQPLDLVTAIDESLNASIDALNTSLTTSQSDVQTALTDNKNDACPSGTCTSTDIANYLETIQ